MGRVAHVGEVDLLLDPDGHDRRRGFGRDPAARRPASGRPRHWRPATRATSDRKDLKRTIFMTPSRPAGGRPYIYCHARAGPGNPGADVAPLNDFDPAGTPKFDDRRDEDTPCMT